MAVWTNVLLLLDLVKDISTYERGGLSLHLDLSISGNLY